MYIKNSESTFFHNQLHTEKSPYDTCNINKLVEKSIIEINIITNRLNKLSVISDKSAQGGFFIRTTNLDANHAALKSATLAVTQLQELGNQLRLRTLSQTT